MSIALPSSSADENMSEYERERLENIRALKLELGGVFLDVQKSASDLATSTAGTSRGTSNRQNHRSQNSQHWRKVKIAKRSTAVEHVRRSARIIYDKKKPTNYNEQSDNDENETKKTRKGSLRIKFPFFKNNGIKQKDEDYYKSLNDCDFLSDDDLDDYKEPVSKRRRSLKLSSSPTRLTVSQITPEMLSNITYSSCNKNYSPLGTTCHQCRQKTTDQKSYCRYKYCRGARGMFCGFCLGKRYGEDVAVVLLDKKWACPPCRGYCNCSICRRREGKPPTGQMVTLANAQGFDCVRDLLSTIEGENPNVLSEDEDNDNDNDTQCNENKSKINSSEDNVSDHSETASVSSETVSVHSETASVSSETTSLHSEIESVQSNLDSSDTDDATKFNSIHEKRIDSQTIIDNLYKEMFLSPSVV